MPLEEGRRPVTLINDQMGLREMQERVLQRRPTTAPYVSRLRASRQIPLMTVLNIAFGIQAVARLLLRRQGEEDRDSEETTRRVTAAGNTSTPPRLWVQAPAQ